MRTPVAAGSLALALALWAPPRIAAADLAGEAYQDFKGVLEDLAKTRAAMKSRDVQLAIEYANEIAPAGDTLFSALPADTLGQCVAKVTEKLNGGRRPRVARG